MGGIAKVPISPIRRYFRAASGDCGGLRLTDADDFPLQVVTAGFAHALADQFAQCLKLGGGGAIGVQQEIRVLFGHLRAAQPVPAQARRIDSGTNPDASARARCAGCARHNA